MSLVNWGNMSLPRSNLTLVVLRPTFAVFAAWLICDWGGPSTVTVVSDVGSLVAGGFALVCAAVTAHASHGRALGVECLDDRVGGMVLR